ncbi:hypothetical protein ACLB2K_073977 [Fragaria x ananassa]
MLSVKPYDSATKSSLKLFTDAITGLGPWMDPVPPSIREDYQHATQIPTLAFRNSTANIQRWQQTGIADAIDLSFQLQSIGVNKAPMMAATCFWDTSSNTFNFGFGQMGIMLLDLCAITGLPVSNKLILKKKQWPLKLTPIAVIFIMAHLDTRPLAADLLYSVQESPSHRFFILLKILWLLGMAFAGAKAYDLLAYSDCFQHLYTLDASALDASELMLNRMYPEALANKFMWGTTYSLEALHLFDQAISIAHMKLPNDIGFELYAPNHFSHQLGFQKEIPSPLFGSVNMYTS